MNLTLTDWLDRISRQHPSEIELGLERCGEVFKRLNLAPFAMPVITVAGTNGKGTTVAYLDALARSSGKRPLTFTSPHLYNYRERLTYDGNWLAEQQHIDAFAAIEQAAGDIPLTFFEYSALSAFYCCSELQTDLLILEVGLGGRLDTTNIVPADVAVITTIDLDHQEYLGDTIEQIAREKLGIVKPNSTVILADDTVPTNCIDDLQCNKIIQSHVDYQVEDECWYSGMTGPLSLPEHIEPKSNTAAALAAYNELFPALMIEDMVAHANEAIALPGRFQQVIDEPSVILDVAHNPQAVAHLVKRLKVEGKREVHLVLGMMADKNVTRVIELLSEITAYWYLTDLDSVRAASAADLSEITTELGISLDKITCYSSPLHAYEQALKSLHGEQGTILVVGSFLTVGPVLELVNN